MTSLNILVLFFIFFIARFIFSYILDTLNIQNLIRNRKQIPNFLSSQISEEKYSKSVRYSLRKEYFSLLTTSIATLITAAVILSRFVVLIENKLSLFELHPYVHGILFLLILSSLSSLLALPVTIYSQFIIEEEFGFNKMTGKIFIFDMIKNTILSLILFIPLMAVLFIFVDKAGNYWWIYGFLFFASFQLIVSLLYPQFIAPLFNKFSDLGEGPLKERLVALAERTSFKAKGIYIMDGSKRSSHSNAYFTGFGKSRRIVLYDTLLESLSDEEIEGVLAHEIGHFKKKHIVKGLVTSLIMALALFYILSLLAQYTPLFGAFGFRETSFHGLLVILSFCLGPFTFFLKPLFTIKSRKNEYEADSFAAETMGSAEPLKSALIVLGKENLSNLTPHPLYSFFHYSHPVLSERIKALD